MALFVSAVTGVFDQLNPFNLANLILFFAWLALFTFTTVAVWRSNSAWLRLLSFLVNQVFSVGIVLSWTLTSLLAYTYWQHSLAVVAATGMVALWLFRRRPAEQGEGA
ncbi:MAG: hypothetical protein QNJ94_16680 [Alphaproteobacteria bacterium]|nr:hypothetical protein [Alphaproteobacteria bacterium]